MDFGLSKYKMCSVSRAFTDRFLYMAATDVFGTIAISWVVSYFSNIRFFGALRYMAYGNRSPPTVRRSNHDRQVPFPQQLHIQMNMVAVLTPCYRL
jgi:hypothetical protein